MPLPKHLVWLQMAVTWQLRFFQMPKPRFYLTASAQSRAERRVNQLPAMGVDVKINDILANIEARDKSRYRK